MTLLTAAGELRTIDLGAATSVKLSDPKQQTLLKDYLSVLNNARSKDRRSVYIDSLASAARELVASYMTPAAVWKSSYRLLFTGAAEPTLEGWAIVDNTSGEDWNNVKLSVVSGRPISFISQLYPPRYVQRPTAELAEDRAVGPQVFQGAHSRAGSLGGPAPASLAPPTGRWRRRTARRQRGRRRVRPAPSTDRAFRTASHLASVEQSSFSSVASGQDVGELFEYSFASPVTVKMGESAMLPFLQQKVGARKLLIYSESMGLHPMNAAEVSNSTGKTLDGGPITVYDAGAYAGEALVETLKAGDKRLIGYGVDLGMRISTKWDSSANVVREIHLRRGILTTRNAIQETKTYTIKNVDAQAKTLVIEHAERSGYKLLEPDSLRENLQRVSLRSEGRRPRRSRPSPSRRSASIDQIHLVEQRHSRRARHLAPEQGAERCRPPGNWSRSRRRRAISPPTTPRSRRFRPTRRDVNPGSGARVRAKHPEPERRSRGSRIRCSSTRASSRMRNPNWPRCATTRAICARRKPSFSRISTR